MKTHRERLEDALAGVRPDRTPVALWRHFPVDDQTAGGLAAASLVFQKTYDFDLVKVTPQSAFCIEDWGAINEWRGDPEGTCTYTHRVVQAPEDWTRLQVLDPNKGRLGEQLACLRMLREALGPDTPLVQTIFSPLAQAKNLAGGDLALVHLRRYPEQFKAGMATIAESIHRFIEAILATGIDGVFYAVQHAQYGLLTEAEYLEFGRTFDLRALEPASELWLNLLHLHGLNVMFNLFADYPIQAINWHDQETEPSLSDAQKRFKGALCGGLQRDRTMLLGTPEMVTAEAQRAIQATNGMRFILGTGCVSLTTTPFGNLMAARRSVE